MRIHHTRLQQARLFLRRQGGLLIAGLWRRLMWRTTFIVISGSVGKTTCKELTGHILAGSFPTVYSEANVNHYKGVVRTVLRVRPWHRYAVIEVGIDRPGQMLGFARMLRPDIAVLTNIARTHMMNFGTLEVITAEKTILVEQVRPGGLAILNDDSPYLAAYQPPAGIRTMYYGSTERSVARAVETSGAFPERFAMTAVLGSEQVRVQTNLVGTHWSPSVLPALLLARHAGIPMDQAASAIKATEPMNRRLAPTVVPGGAVFIRDESNGSIDTLPPALQVIRNAHAERRLVVFTDVTDSKKRPRNRIREIAREIAAGAEGAVFLGEHCEHGAKAAIEAGLPPENVRTFYRIRDAANHLKGTLRSGDVVLLRGRRVDHLDRIPLSMLQEVTCWKEECHLVKRCDKCRKLNRPEA